MVFSSIFFLCYFFPVFLAVYRLLPAKDAVLLGASLLFYAWGEPLYIGLLLAYILVNWGCGRLLSLGGSRARVVLWLGVGANLAMLFTFKYAAFFVTQAGDLAGWLGLPRFALGPMALPLGISFFTFQGISYLIDIHRHDVAPQRGLLKFAMYKAMFPQLVAGPIVRYRQICGKIERRRRVSLFRLRFGILLFLLGLAQKVLIANTVAVPADQIFATDPAQLSAGAAWLGAAAYTLQIYFDFNGYSNMAIGMGHMLGFSYPPNFRRPYISQSITEFWRRWHISLSTWFRDYLYIPLGGNRRGRPRTYANLLAVFLLCGLWHGASWTFMAWGAYHGVFLIAERLGAAAGLPRPWRPVRHAYALLAVMVGWVVFRSDTLPQAGSFLHAMAGVGAGAVPAASFLGHSAIAALVAGAVFAVVPAFSERDVARHLGGWLGLGHGSARRVIGTMVGASALTSLVVSLLSLAAGSYNPFIYFRF